MKSDIYTRFFKLKDSVTEMSTARVSRTDLGRYSFDDAGRVLDSLKTRIKIIEPILNSLSVDVANNFFQSAERVRDSLLKLANAPFDDLAIRRDELTRSLEGLEFEMDTSWPAIIAVAVEKSDILISEDFEKRLVQSKEQALTELSDLASKLNQRIEVLNAEFGVKMLSLATESEAQVSRSVTLSEERLRDVLSTAEAKFEEASRLTLEKAAAQADRIEARAREAAKEVSVAAAQAQFNSAQISFRWKAACWSVLTILSFISLFVYTNMLFKQADQIPANENLHQLIYKAVLRFTILTAIGAIATFFLRMTRAHFHMLEQNSHRRRVANSMVAFVDAAMTREQRDLILGKLVESVVDFGDSGILDKEKDSITGSTIAIDALSKTFTQKTA